MTEIPRKNNIDARILWKLNFSFKTLSIINPNEKQGFILECNRNVCSIEIKKSRPHFPQTEPFEYEKDFFRYSVLVVLLSVLLLRTSAASDDSNAILIK